MELIKKWGATAGSIAAIVAVIGIGASWADIYIDRRVEIRVAGMLKGELDGLSRKLNGLQEQTNSGQSDNRVIKEQLRSIEKQQAERDDAMQKQLDLIIKLIEKKQ